MAPPLALYKILVLQQKKQLQCNYIPISQMTIAIQEGDEWLFWKRRAKFSAGKCSIPKSKLKF